MPSPTTPLLSHFDTTPPRFVSFSPLHHLPPSQCRSPPPPNGLVTGVNSALRCMCLVRCLIVTWISICTSTPKHSRSSLLSQRCSGVIPFLSSAPSEVSPNATLVSNGTNRESFSGTTSRSRRMIRIWISLLNWYGDLSFTSFRAAADWWRCSSTLRRLMCSSDVR